MRRKSLGDLIADGLLGVSRRGGEHRRDWAGGDIAAGELRVRCPRALDRFVDDRNLAEARVGHQLGQGGAVAECER